FLTTVAVKKVNDVTRSQALMDKKKVVVTEATIRDALRFDDAGGVECLPNEEIFVELARMGYEKPSTKLTFYKAFFSSQWNLVRNVDSPTKFYIYPRFLQLMIRKQVGDLSTHTTKYTSPALTQKVYANMRRVGKGFSRVETPLFEGIIVEQQVAEGDDEVHNEGVPAASIVAEGDKLEKRNKLKVLKLKRLKRIGSAQRIDTSNDTVMDDVSKQGGIIENIDADEDVVLEDAKDEEELEPTELQEVVDIVTTTKIITEVVTAASTTINAADVPILAATLTLTAAPSKRTKGVVIRDPEESTTTTSTIIHSEAKSKDKGKWILAKEDKAVKRYQALKRKPQTKAQARKNMMIYLKNVAGFKMDYFKGMYYEDIRPIFEKHFDSNVAFLQKTKEQMDEEYSRALKRLNESQEEKATKKQKLEKEMLNNVRLEVEEESEVSLELLRFIRQQHQEETQLE
nr:hypothetical protein [Tanacetum cinerariifolium]